MPKILEENKLIVKFDIGEIETGSERLNVSHGTNGTPVIDFEDGTTVYWTWEELIKQAMEIKEQQKTRD